MTPRIGNLWSLARGHLGDDVSALVDDQLPPEEAERCWSHVLTCVSCRQLVEREGWLKSQLGGLGASEIPVAEQVRGSLSAPPHPDMWLRTERAHRVHRSRRVAAAGLGSAVVGVVALAGAGMSPALVSGTMARDVAAVVSNGLDGAAATLADIAR